MKVGSGTEDTKVFASCNDDTGLTTAVNGEHGHEQFAANQGSEGAHFSSPDR